MYMHHIKQLCLLTGFLYASIPWSEAGAFENPINAERPGFSSSPVPLAPGLLQLEGGLQDTRIDSNIDVQVAPLLLLRAGLRPNLELQVAWSGYTWLDGPGFSEHGITDMTVGVKTQLTDQVGSRPAIGLLGILSLPIGDDVFSSDEVDPSLGVLWTYALQDGPGLFGTVLLSSPTQAGDRETQITPAVGVSFSHTERLSSYTEYFGTFPEEGGPAHVLNGGFAYLFSEDIQLDVHVGFGLNSRADDRFIGAGFAKRW